MILIYILLTVLRDVVIVENTDPRDAIEYIMLDLRRVSDELDILSSSLDQLFHRRFIVKLQMDTQIHCVVGSIRLVIIQASWTVSE